MGRYNFGILLLVFWDLFILFFFPIFIFMISYFLVYNTERYCSFLVVYFFCVLLLCCFTGQPCFDDFYGLFHEDAPIDQ